MLIDWFTVAAQIVNFLILIFLLKHFLYGPIIRAMDRRQEMVVSRLQEADEKWQEAEGEKERLAAQQRELKHQREELLAEARQEAEELRKQLTTQAREEVARLQERWQASLQSEQESFLKELQRRAGLQVYAVAGKALAELADADLEQRMVDSALGRLEKLEGEPRDRLQESARNATALVVRSAFAIPDKDRQRLTKRLHEVLVAKPEVRYETAPELLCGIEIDAHGCMIGWNLGEYLRELEEDLGRALEEGISHGETKRNGE
jgi:F-type H+-transporting ATPase subunit b